MANKGEKNKAAAAVDDKLEIPDSPVHNTYTEVVTLLFGAREPQQRKLMKLLAALKGHKLSKTTRPILRSQIENYVAFGAK